MTIDLFTLPHKALRTYVGLTATRLGALDPNHPHDVAEMQSMLHGLIDELAAHGGREDAFILPLLDRRLPDMASRMRVEHAEVAQALAELRRGAELLASQASAGSQLALYREVRRFEALNLRHLDFEETVVMPALWLVAPTEDLAELMAAFHAAHPDASDLYRRAPEALTAAERTLVGV